MPITDAGLAAFVRLVFGGSESIFNNANTKIGVGDSNTAFSVSQTDLQAATNKLRKAVAATYPAISANVITFRTTFTVDEANFAWEEWGIFNAASGGTMIVREVESLGTKTSAQSWQFTITMTLVAS